MSVTYNWLHIPTGTKGSRTGIFLNYNDFYEKIEQWNKQGDILWKYY
jgi:hypothetical protein